MRDKEYFKEQMQKHRFNERLTQTKQTRTLCVYCDKLAETLHHINENQSDNRLKNLLPVCHEHHLNIPHDCDITFTDRFKSLKMPLKPVNSSKNAEYYLNSNDESEDLFKDLENDLYAHFREKTSKLPP